MSNADLIRRLRATGGKGQCGPLKAEAAAALEAHEWNTDMDAAPKDGTKILWRGDNGEFAKKRFTYSVICWPEYSDCFEFGGAWKHLDAPPDTGKE